MSSGTGVQNSAEEQPQSARNQSKSVTFSSQSQECVKLSELKVQYEKLKTYSKHRILLHFTSKESAESIQDGIRIALCQNKSEFAVDGAFYLTDSIDFGLRWLETRYRSTNCAVLLFEVPESYFQKRRCSYLEFANDEWKKFCYHNVNVGEGRMQRQELEVQNDIMIGPICKFRAIPPRHPDYTTLEPFLDSTQNICMQHAILKQGAADEILNYLTKIWFLVE